MKKLFEVNIFILALLPSLIFTLPLQADEIDTDIKIDNAYVPQLPPSAMTRAAYFTITNASSQTRTVTGIHADGFKMAHFHETEVIDGVTSMKSVHALEIKPGETLALEPGGLHIMLMSPDQTSTSHGEVPITLTFANGNTVNLVASIQAAN